MKVLVIEDNQYLRETLVEAFKEEGYTVESSVDGEDGLYKAIEGGFDLAIVDVMIPLKDGWEVLQGIRAHPKSRELAVIMLTARDSTADRVKGLDYGADDYLTKPFKLVELLARIRAITRRSVSYKRGVEIEIGETVLDTKTRSIRHQGEEVGVTALEYNLVEILANRRGNVVSRSELYLKLFSEEKEVVSNILDVYICNLRGKFGKDFIKTKRGFGYYISE